MRSLSKRFTGTTHYTHSSVRLRLGLIAVGAYASTAALCLKGKRFYRVGTVYEAVLLLVLLCGYKTNDLGHFTCTSLSTAHTILFFLFCSFSTHPVRSLSIGQHDSSTVRSDAVFLSHTSTRVPGPNCTGERSCAPPTPQWVKIVHHEHVACYDLRAASTRLTIYSETACRKTGSSLRRYLPGNPQPARVFPTDLLALPRWRYRPTSSGRHRPPSRLA